MRYKIYERNGELYDVLWPELYDNDEGRMQNVVAAYRREGYIIVAYSEFPRVA